GYRTPAGAYKLAFPNREPWEMPPNESCALDLADEHDEREPRPMVEVARVMNHTQQRIQQLETSAFAKLVMTPIGRELASALGRRRRGAVFVEPNEYDED